MPFDDWCIDLAYINVCSRQIEDSHTASTKIVTVASPAPAMWCQKQILSRGSGAWLITSWAFSQLLPFASNHMIYRSPFTRVQTNSKRSILASVSSYIQLLPAGGCAGRVTRTALVFFFLVGCWPRSAAFTQQPRHPREAVARCAKCLRRAEDQESMGELFTKYYRLQEVGSGDGHVIS